jgi:hypothetical protein
MLPCGRATTGEPNHEVPDSKRWCNSTLKCDYLVVEDCSRAQAVELIRALHCQPREMTVHLAWLDACGMRMDAAALSRDIQEAHAHIDRLQRRYLDMTSSVGAALLAADSVVSPA